MKNNKILVTGGAGYIGSHVVRQLGSAGEDVITLDNLSTGFEAAVTAGELVIGDTGDEMLLDKVFSGNDIDTVMHFAAHTIVPESVADPLKYYRNNTASSRTLLEAAARHGVKNIVFSSTAAVYGIPDGGRASEDSPTQPINPYGTSKLMTEWMLRDLSCRRLRAEWHDWSVDTEGNPARQGRLRGRNREAPRRGYLRYGLSHAGWHRPAGLYSRRRSRDRTP
jgi:UDP-glucose 4-epimerase